MKRCNICGSETFAPGPNGRLSKNGLFPQCKQCGSLERHRAFRNIAKLLSNKLDFSSMKVLQFSEDQSFDPRWFGEFELSVYGGFNSLDIRKIHRPDSSYDLVICNHVIEHVDDDRKALLEMMRILKKDGLLFLSFPSPLEVTRTIEWGFPDKSQHGHYRIYGKDVILRFKDILKRVYLIWAAAIDPVTCIEESFWIATKSYDTFKKVIDALKHGNIRIIVSKLSACHDGAEKPMLKDNYKNVDVSPEKSVAYELRANILREFIHPSTRPDFIDRYVVRSAIKRVILQYMFLFRGTLLDVGCGQMPYRELIISQNPNVRHYIGLDFPQGKYALLKKPDLAWDGEKIPIRNEVVDTVIATEVLEHLPDPLKVLKEIRRVLKPNGVFFFTTLFLWPLHDVPGDYYRYTPYSLRKLLLEAGFEDVDIKPLGGWNTAFAQMIGLWLRRSPISEKSRQQIYNQLYPFYAQLIASESDMNMTLDVNAENVMTPGWVGIAYTPRESVARRMFVPSPNESPRICIFRHERYAYSQTFIEDHIAYLSPNVQVIHGEFLPMYDDNKRCVLGRGFVNAVQGVDLKSINTIYTKMLAEYLKREQFDVVLAEFGVVGAKVYKACEDAKIPYVVHFHGYDAYVHDVLKQYSNQYQDMFKSAAAIVTVSNAMKNQLISLGAPPDKVIINPYGVDTSWEEIAKPEHAPPVFVAVGRFVEKKAPHLTIRAFQRVVAAVPDARLVMIGNGPLLEYCRKLVEELSMADKVIFAGVHHRRSVARFMQSARAFVQHSLTASNGDSEGLPVAILEAGALGLPVVSTRHAGIVDAVVEGENGFLVDEGDWEGMAEAMIALARNARLAGAMGRSFRKRVERWFSRERSILKLRDILIKAIGKKKSFPSYAAILQKQQQVRSSKEPGVISKTDKQKALEERLLALTIKKDFQAILDIAKVEKDRTPLVSYLIGNACFQRELYEDAVSHWEKAVEYGDPSLVFVRHRLDQLVKYPAMVIGKETLYQDEPRVHILILTRNRRYYLEKTFKCLGKTEYANYSVFLLDNCSDDGTREILPKLKRYLPSNVELVYDSLPTNIGRPGGHNWMLTAWDHSNADFIAIIDDDVVYFKPNWLRLFVNTFMLKPDIGAVGAKTLQMDGRIQDAFPIVDGTDNYTNIRIFTHRDEYDIGQHDLINNIPDYVTGCFSVFRTEVFRKAGLFDIRYSPSQCVDIDHGIRMRKAGYDLIYNGNIGVVHAQLTHEERKRDVAAVANFTANAYKLVHKLGKDEVDWLIQQRRLRQKAFWEDQ